MKLIITTFLFLFTVVHYGMSQDSAVFLSAKMLEAKPVILLSPMEGWIFKLGNDPSWANKKVNTSDWIKLKPTELSAKYADKTGKVEGWFRVKFKLDSDSIISLGFKRGGWAATDVYVDGNLLSAFGNTGENGKEFKEYNPIDKPSIFVKLEPGQEHLLAIHFVDYLSPFPPRQLKSETKGGVRPETSKGLELFIFLTGPDYNSYMLDISRQTRLYRSIWLSVTLLLAVLFWLLFFQNPNEKKTLLLIAVYSSFSALSNLMRFYLTDTDISFVGYRMSDFLQRICIWMIVVLSFFIAATILNFKLARNLKRFLFAYSFLGALGILFDFFDSYLAINVVIAFLVVAYILISSWKKLKGAQWAIATGLLLSILLGTFLVINTGPGITIRLFQLTCFYFSFPFSLLVYVSIRFREIMNDVRENARQVVQMSEEKKEQALNQQKILQQEVDRQTAEIRNTLDDLRSTQSQLIQSEKMASLGELTAGIAHEIQNPLNFVNNFSEVNAELAEELKSELAAGNEKEAIELIDTIKENEEKIIFHGKRADAIVKSMLQHSRAGSDKKEFTDLNALSDEYMRLSYHGLRAKDKSFNAKFETDFDPAVGKINVIPQEIGRVILNLINNAFYAVSEKKKLQLDGYEPTVVIKTRKVGDNIQIHVRDNGGGIPQKVVDKIFQPFFTTKPTGEGTGLGLSLSYDIITKAHGGDLKVESNEGEGAEFIITLPKK